MNHRAFLRFVANLAEIEHSRVRLRCPEADIVNADLLTIGHDDGPLDDVFELANVSGPCVRLESVERVGQKRHDTATLFGREAAHEAVGEQRRINLAHTQRRYVDDDFG